MTKYKLRPTPGWKFKFDPQKVGQRLTSLEKEHKKLSANIVLEDAKKTSSPYHNQFDWNDKTASNSWRLHTARNLIRSIEITIEDDKGEPINVNAYTSIAIKTSDGKQEYVYVKTEVVLENMDTREIVFEELRKDLKRTRDKYNRYSYLATILDKLKV